MRERTEQSISQNKARLFFDALAAEKKKGITAVCLLTVMTLMWARVFMGKSPQTTPAGQSDQVSVTEQYVSDSNGVLSGLSIHYIALPKIEGRNDRLKRDFFTGKGDFEQNSNLVSASGQPNKIIRKVESMLKLEAVFAGNNPQAYINNKLLKTGDKLDIVDGNIKYECVIEKISEMEVVIDCLGTKIKLKTANPSEVIE